MSATVNSAAVSFEVRFDQRTDIDVAGGDHAVEWGHDIREPLLRFQPVDVCLGRLDLRRLDTRVALLFIDGLLRHGAGGAERIPPLGGHFRQCEVRLGLREFALRDSDALVEFGRVHDGQHLALMNLRADVLAPFLDIAARLPMNGRADKGFDVAGQDDFARPAALLRRDKRDRRGPPARWSIAPVARAHAAGRRLPVAAIATAATAEEDDRAPGAFRPGSAVLRDIRASEASA